jgi:hypothetical protein
MEGKLPNPFGALKPRDKKRIRNKRKAKVKNGYKGNVKEYDAK